MNKLLISFDYLADVPIEVDRLIAEAGKTRGKKEKHELLVKAQTLSDAYQEHCVKNGNNTKQFNKIF